MKEFRVTRYDPNLRSPEGYYIPDDWTSISYGTMFLAIGLAFIVLYLLARRPDRPSHRHLKRSALK